MTLAALLLLWITTPSSASELRPPTGMREKARAVLLKHCGECHDPERVTALPQALRIYDLSHADWSAQMTDRQLRALPKRLSDRRTMTDAELRAAVPKESPMPKRPSIEETQILESYTAQELQSRLLRSLPSK